MTGPIFIAPAHPCMGWASMNRYAQELSALARGQPAVRFLLPPTAADAPPASRWMRLLQRRIMYPWKVRVQVKSGLLHVLDHSFASLLTQARPGVRKVVTVHDLIPLRETEGLSAAQRARYAREVSHLKQADMLVCVSGHTRGEVHRLLGVPFERMMINPMGAAVLPPPDPVMREQLGHLPPFLLSVGHNAPRKNLALLPELARHLAASGEKPVFVRAGAGLDQSLASALRAHASLHELGRINDAELAAAYHTAAVLLLPSRHEGFGLPVIEAMACGCPVVCARAASLPEVAGDAALLFDPDDAAEAARACLRLLRDPDFRETMIQTGRQRAAQFTYAAHWERLRAVYASL